MFTLAREVGQYTSAIMSNRVATILGLAVLVSATGLLGQATLGVKIDSSGTVVEVHPGTAGEKAGLKAGDTITGLNNHPIQGEAEITSTLAKTRPGSLLPVTIRRNGHPQTLLAFPSAAAGATAPPNAGVAPVNGHYTCFTFTFMGGAPGGLGEAPSSLSTGIDLLPGGQYMALKEKGRYHADVKTDRLVFDSGPLVNAYAHLQRGLNGSPKIGFVQDENRHAINGHEIDHGPTGCYLK